MSKEVTVNQRLKIEIKSKYGSLRNAAIKMGIDYGKLYSGLKSESGSPSISVLLHILYCNPEVDANWITRGERHEDHNRISELEEALAYKESEINRLKDLFLTEESSAMRQELLDIKKQISNIMDKL